MAKDFPIKGMTDDYCADAHTTAHHGGKGRAVGKKGDNMPMEYSTKLRSEGASSAPVASIPADHNMGGNKAAHSFPSHKGEAHSFGHPAHLRKGGLRLSGHKGAHMVGRKK